MVNRTLPNTNFNKGGKSIISIEILARKETGTKTISARLAANQREIGNAPLRTVNLKVMV